MKLCVVGAGAIGGVIGARLAQSGRVSVSAVARGATAAALAQHGWRVRHAGNLLTAPVAAVSDDPRTLGRQDVVVIAVKAQSLAAVARDIAPLLGPTTIVLPAMNGVPWWFCRGLAGPAGRLDLASVDPGGVIAAAIPVDRVIGCVVHLGASMPEPGLVHHTGGLRLIVGEPDGQMSTRLLQIADLLAGGGFEVEQTPAIRAAIWYKLWGNLTMNPVSALTGATIDLILDDPYVAQLCHRAMTEAAAVGAKFGCMIEQAPEERSAITRQLGAVKTSMLQDVEAGRSIELDAIVGAVIEIARTVQVPTPTIETIFGLARLMARQRGLYPSV